MRSKPMILVALLLAAARFPRRTWEPPCACGRWLPVRLPGFLLATLMFGSRYLLRPPGRESSRRPRRDSKADGTARPLEARPLEADGGPPPLSGSVLQQYCRGVSAETPCEMLHKPLTRKRVFRRAGGGSRRGSRIGRERGRPGQAAGVASVPSMPGLDGDRG